MEQISIIEAVEICALNDEILITLSNGSKVIVRDSQIPISIDWIPRSPEPEAETLITVVVG